MSDVNQEDPFGFGADARAAIKNGEQDELLIPDVLPEDSEFLDD